MADTTNLVSEVDGLGHMTKEPDLNDTGEHLDPREELMKRRSAVD